MTALLLCFPVSYHITHKCNFQDGCFLGQKNPTKAFYYIIWLNRVRVKMKIYIILPYQMWRQHTSILCGNSCKQQTGCVTASQMYTVNCACMTCAFIHIVLLDCLLFFQYDGTNGLFMANFLTCRSRKSTGIKTGFSVMSSQGSQIPAFC